LRQGFLARKQQVGKREAIAVKKHPKNHQNGGNL